VSRKKEYLKVTLPIPTSFIYRFLKLKWPYHLIQKNSNGYLVGREDSILVVEINILLGGKIVF